MNPTATAYVGVEIFDGHKRHKNSALVVESGRVERILPADDLPGNSKLIALEGGTLAPGLVDLQVNGGGGVMLNNAPDADTIATMCRANGRCGTTSILPTLITDTPDQTRAAIAAVRDAISEGIVGVAGLHLEGPHLSVARKGAHDPKLIRPMEDADCRALEEVARELPSLLLTVAPESVTPDQVGRLAAAGIIVSLGHTDCSFQTAKDYARSGATCVTHLFNAMSQLGNREPGLVGAVLDCADLSAGLIADGFHSDPASIRIALKAKRGPGRIFLVSDAMATIDSDIASFNLNGRRISRGQGRLTLDDGTLAGADIDLMSAVRFMVDSIGLDQDEALRMATLNPAQVLGRSADIGQLAEGRSADFILFDNALQIQQVWRQGSPIL